MLRNFILKQVEDIDAELSTVQQELSEVRKQLSRMPEGCGCNSTGRKSQIERANFKAANLKPLNEKRKYLSNMKRNLSFGLKAKLVRDNSELDRKEIVNVTGRKERLLYLATKLLEEASELYDEIIREEYSEAATTEEMADVLEVIDTIKDHLSLDEDKVKEVKEEKAAKRGRFKTFKVKKCK